jgi:hypothetical protein
MATTSDIIRERQMSIDADVLNSEPAHLLSSMYATEYPPQSLPREPSPVPSMLNALGACAGFAAQVAVWRELVLPTKRNPGEFFVYAITKSRETFFFGVLHRPLRCRPPIHETVICCLPVVGTEVGLLLGAHEPVSELDPGS